MKRRGNIILALSVILNVLFAGMLLGDVSHCLVLSSAPGMEAQLAKLPQDKRTLFQSIMGPAKQKMDSEHAKIDEAKAEALRILKSEPFNKEAYLTQIQHINDMHAQMKLHIADAVATLAKQFTPDERVVLAEIISHPPFVLPRTEKPGQ